MVVDPWNWGFHELYKGNEWKWEVEQRGNVSHKCVASPKVEPNWKSVSDSKIKNRFTSRFVYLLLRSQFHLINLTKSIQIPILSSQQGPRTMVNLGSPAKMYLLLFFQYSPIKEAEESSISPHIQQWVCHSGFAIAISVPQTPFSRQGRPTFPDHVAWISFLLMDEIRIYLVLSSQVLMNYQRKPFNISIPISILQVFSSVFPNFPPFAGTSTNGGSPIAGWFLLWKIDLQLDDLGSTPWPPASVARPPPPQDPAARGPAGPAPWRPAASGLGAPPRRHGEGGQAWVHLEAVVVKRENMKIHDLLAVL